MEPILEHFWTIAPLFRGLDADGRRRVAGDHSWSVTTGRRGEFIALMGDPIERLSLVVAGTIAAEVVAARGVLIIETLTPGALLAGPILFTTDPRFPVQLRVVEECTIVSLPRCEVLRMLARHPVVLENFLREGGEKILFLAEKIRLLQFASMRQKIAGYFLEVARRKGGGEIQLGYTLETLAVLFGVTRPALSRCLGQMVEEGSLSRLPGKGRFRVSEDLLAEILDEE